MAQKTVDSCSVPAADLYRSCDSTQLPFETTADVAPLDGIVGQDRALSSLEFGLEIQADGYNLFVAGPAGTGRNTTLRALVGRIAAGRPRPPDWCYVYNFRDHRQPSVMSLPAGRGRSLARDMDAFIEACRREIPGRFESDAYRERRDEAVKEVHAERERTFSELEQEVRSQGFAVNATAVGITTVPLKEDGKPMEREEFAQLPEEKRKELQARGEELQALISQAMSQTRRLEKEAQGLLAELDKSVALNVITPLLDDLRQEYLDIPKAIEYLAGVQDDIVEHLSTFRSPEQESGSLPVPRPSDEEFFTRYKVNVIVSHEDAEGAPVVIENNPTYYNLFGRVDYRSQMGSVTTDHTMIKAGALHRANGGYLILQALDALSSPFVWETMKRTIRCREARIENMGEQYSAIPVATLSPQAVPLDVKIVMVGNPSTYHLLLRSDEDFRKFFRVKADFTSDMERDAQGVSLYAGFVSSRVQQEGLRPFDSSAVARVVEFGSRLVEHQEKLSTRFIEIANLLTEADFWAGKDGDGLIGAKHVERAIEEKVYRSNLIEERVHEVIKDGTVQIDTEGEVIGQVNGIAVYDLGDYRFGRPSRITARTSVGRGQVVNIEREIQMSGRIHSKGFLILSGFLHGRFGRQRPLALAASIGFEQTYDEVDGDSASSAELYALLSALAEAPIKQGIAVTGAVDQWGEVQAVGGTHAKIEGFYAVCKAKGLTGQQGVIIPRENVKHLMLRKEVVNAVREGRFHVWAVSHVDEGIEILTGVVAGERDRRGRYPRETLNRRVADKLAQMARRVSAGRRRGRSAKEDETNDDDKKGAP
ncbi:MAG: AAA family ATPase [Chloroflexi bacterium]|nr:AAA family ATPase [Chloroflexota bacterium]